MLEFINFYLKVHCLVISCLEHDIIMRLKSIRIWQNSAIPFTTYIFSAQNSQGQLYLNLILIMVIV